MALIPTVVIFLGWDMLAIARHHWRFSERYLVGWSLPADVPIEELVFFIAIPICGLLTLEAVRRLLRSSSRA
jgi:lycopene cyclase domain-containing protein